MKKIPYSFDDSFEEWCRKSRVEPCTCTRPGVTQHDPSNHGASCPVKAAFDTWAKAGEAHWQMLNQSAGETAPTTAAN
jgi:hypothetical protein